MVHIIDVVDERLVKSNSSVPYDIGRLVTEADLVSEERLAYEHHIAICPKCWPVEFVLTPCARGTQLNNDWEASIVRRAMADGRIDSGNLVRE